MGRETKFLNFFRVEKRLIKISFLVSLFSFLKFFSYAVKFEIGVKGAGVELGPML